MIGRDRLVFLVAAVRSVVEAEDEEKKARADYSGRSWGYHGHVYDRDIDRAYDELDKILTEILEAQVKEADGT